MSTFFKPPFYRWGNWGSERWNNLPKIMAHGWQSLGHNPMQSGSWVRALKLHQWRQIVFVPEGSHLCPFSNPHPCTTTWVLPACPLGQLLPCTQEGRDFERACPYCPDVWDWSFRTSPGTAWERKARKGQKEHQPQQVLMVHIKVFHSYFWVLLFLGSSHSIIDSGFSAFVHSKFFNWIPTVCTQCVCAYV